LARLEPSTIKKIKSLIKASLLSLTGTIESLMDEVKRQHCLSVKQSIVDYILLDKSERQRLMIPTLIERYSPKICRAPVPWHESLLIPKDYLENNLFIANPMMIHILAAYEPYKKTKIIDMSVFTPSILPISVDEFGAILKSQCQSFKSKMLNEYFLLTSLDGCLQLQHVSYRIRTFGIP
jgi:dynein heavy chain